MLNIITTLLVRSNTSSFPERAYPQLMDSDPYYYPHDPRRKYARNSELILRANTKQSTSGDLSHHDSVNVRIDRTLSIGRNQVFLAVLQNPPLISPTRPDDDDPLLPGTPVVVRVINFSINFIHWVFTIWTFEHQIFYENGLVGLVADWLQISRTPSVQMVYLDKLLNSGRLLRAVT